MARKAVRALSGPDDLDQFAYAIGVLDGRASFAAHPRRRDEQRIFRITITGNHAEGLGRVQRGLGWDEGRVERAPGTGDHWRLVLEGRIRVGSFLTRVHHLLDLRRAQAEEVLALAREAGALLDCAVPDCWERRLTPRHTKLPLCEKHEAQLRAAGDSEGVLSTARALIAGSVLDPDSRYADLEAALVAARTVNASSR